MIIDVDEGQPLLRNYPLPPIPETRRSGQGQVSVPGDDVRSPTRAMSLALLLCYFFIGMGAWQLIGAIYTEGPLFVTQCPEGYAIYSILDVAVQLANVLPIILSIVFSNRRIRHDFALMALFTLNILASIALALFGDKTISIAGKEHSITLIICAYISGTIGASAMVTLFPFASASPFTSPGFVSAIGMALSAGLGTSGVFASIVGLVQGVDNEIPRFSVRDTYFFWAAFFLLPAVCLMFTMLHTYRTRMRKPSKNPTRKAGSGVLLTAPRRKMGIQRELLNASRREQQKDSMLLPRTWKEIFRGSREVLCHIAVTCFLQYAFVGLQPFTLIGMDTTVYHSYLFWQGTAGGLGSLFGRVFVAVAKLLYRWKAGKRASDGIRCASRTPSPHQTGPYRMAGIRTPFIFMRIGIVAQIACFVLLFLVAFFNYTCYATISESVAPCVLALSTIFSTLYGAVFTLGFDSIQVGKVSPRRLVPLLSDTSSVAERSTDGDINGGDASALDMSGPDKEKLARMGGIANQLGAAVGSLVTFALVQTAIIHDRTPTLSLS